jgi:hypothetical protein
MSTQLLIYETAVPVSSGRHGKAPSRRERATRSRARSIPCPDGGGVSAGGAEYAIVFAQSGEDVMPVVILGARQGENLYLKADDSWNAKYIPAFVRRYPFVFSAPDDGKTFTLCVDEAFQGLNFQGRGQALFTPKASRHPTSTTC